MYQELLSEGAYDNAYEYAQLLEFAREEYEEELAEEQAKEEYEREEYERECLIEQKESDVSDAPTIIEADKESIVEEEYDR